MERSRQVVAAACALAAACSLAAAKVQMPPACTNPDGLAVDPKGRLAIAAPNNDRRQPGAIFRLDEPGGAPRLWFKVPPHPETGVAAPMGICFGPEGEMYICDNQKDSKGRLLRVAFADDRPVAFETVACGLENANGVKYLDGRLYMTSAFLRKLPREDGHLPSGLYMFSAADRNVRVTNTAADPQLVFTDHTAGKVRVGLNGVAVDARGTIYVDNYGDARVWKLTPGPDGRIAAAELFAWQGLKTPDGLCVDAEGNVYTADMQGDAAVRIDRNGVAHVLAKGCFTRPSEPCVWRGCLYVSDYGATTLTVVPLAAEAPFGLTAERLENPCGVDAPAPRLGWKMGVRAGATNVTQAAWRILAASSRAKLAADEGDLWDSGKVEGAQSVDVPYGGAPLATSQRVFWKVKTWSGCGRESGWSAPAEFTMGVMRPSDWKAKWIGPAPETRPDADLGGARWVTAAPDGKGFVTFTRTFDFPGAKPGEHVELLHAASTEHEIVLNGKSCHRHSGHVGRWDWLRFRDVTPWLKAGRNEMKVVVKKAGDAPQAFICAFRFPDGRRLVTDASWGTDLGGVRDTPYGKALHLREEIASPAFEKAFVVAKPVASAVLHVTGVGFYEASLNGAKIGDKVLDPSPTCYDRHVLYSTYRLDGALRPGANTLRILVGHGWYDVRSIATWNFDVAPWRDFPRAIAQLEIAYADGTRETVATDGSWRQVESPVGYDCIREGEVVGAHHRKQPDFAAQEIRAAEVPAPKGRLVAENCPGAKVMRTIAPKAIHAFPGGTYVVEFPENFAGWIRMNVRGQRKGDVLVVRYDERVNADFSPARPSVRDGLHDAVAVDVRKAEAGQETRRIDCHFRYTASQAVCAEGAEFQADRFVSSGAAVEAYEPRFTYNGFQYVVLKGLRAAPRADDITGCVVHTAFPTVGSFACSDETLNALMGMGDRAYRSNFVDGVPTDCPHREKNGWTGDASIASELAQYCYENTAAYEKWLRDLMDTQLPNGDVCCIVPTSGWGFQWGNGPAWDSALPVIAWNLWCYRGDRRVLDAVYPALRRYVDFTSTKADGHLVKHGLGDWIPVDRAHMPSTELTSSCYYRQAAAILSRIAALRGETDVAARYGKLADDIKSAINAKFYKGGGVYDNGRQTAQAFPLAFGVVPEGEWTAVAQKLVDAVEATDGHVDMGLLGTKHVFRALSRIGRTDLAFRMLVNPTKPSPAEWLQKGGTTLWEDWGDGASRNHIMFGDFMAWAYQFLGGIQLPERPGSCAAFPDVTATAFREVLVAPQFIDALTWAKASVDGPCGTIATSWRRTGRTVTLDVTVPPNTTAVIRLPGQADRRVGSGTHTFTVML